MLELELPEPEFTAAQWREQDEQHSCAHCKYAKGTYKDGFRCLAMEKFLADSGRPVKFAYIDDCESICDDYACDYTLFLNNTGEYPKGYDAAESYTDPDEAYHRRMEREHAAA